MLTKIGIGEGRSNWLGRKKIREHDLERDKEETSNGWAGDGLCEKLLLRVIL